MEDQHGREGRRRPLDPPPDVRAGAQEHRRGAPQVRQGLLIPLLGPLAQVGPAHGRRDQGQGPRRRRPRALHRDVQEERLLHVGLRRHLLRQPAQRPPRLGPRQELPEEGRLQPRGEQAHRRPAPPPGQGDARNRRQPRPHPAGGQDERCFPVRPLLPLALDVTPQRVEPDSSSPSSFPRAASTSSPASTASPRPRSPPSTSSSTRRRRSSTCTAPRAASSRPSSTTRTTRATSSPSAVSASPTTTRSSTSCTSLRRRTPSGT